MRGSPRVIGICLGVCVSCVVMLGVKGDLAFAQAGDGFVAADVAVSGPHVYSVGLVGADEADFMSEDGHWFLVAV